MSANPSIPPPDSPLAPLRLPLDGAQRAAFVTLGQTLVGQGRWLAARLVFELLVRANARDAFAQRALGIALAQLQELPAAHAALDAALALAPEDAAARGHRALVRMARGERAGAYADAQAAANAFPDPQAPLARRIRVLLTQLARGGANPSVPAE